MRINGMSIMMTNRSAQAYRNGTCTGVQLPKGSHWENKLGLPYQTSAAISAYDSLAKVSTSRTIEATEGQYGFAKPTSLTDFDMFPLASSDPSDGEDVTVALSPSRASHDYLVIVLRVPNDGGLVNARDFLLTVRWGVEYETLDTWRHLAQPAIDPDVYEKQVTALRAADQWHTNKFHFSDIWKFIKKAAPVVSGVTTALAPLAAANPMIAGALGGVNAGASLIQSLP